MAPLDDGFIDRFSEALVQEIWTEMGRNRITSIRSLAIAMGRNHQYVTARLKHDPKTGKPVPINVVDLYAFADVLGFDPADLMARTSVTAGDELAGRRTPEVSEDEDNIEDLYDEPSAAHPLPRNDVEGDVDPDLQL